MRKLFTSESVTEGHPDKLCDQVSDAVLDAIIAQDPMARVACETFATTGQVTVMGEITTSAYVEIPDIVRQVVLDIGYDSSDKCFDGASCGVMTAIHAQSPDIAQGVDEALEGREESLGDTGAGDQGMMFGFACDETPELMPMPIALSHRLARRLTEVRKNGTLPWLRPDGKTQVTVVYEDDRPVAVDTIVVSTQHAPEVSQEEIRRAILEQVIRPTVPAELLNEDTGLTGRKIIVDTYGGYAPHGGGAFSGKDPTKVDRSAAYAARHAAVNVVAAGLAKKCQIQLAYAIGVARPVSILVETFGTGTVSDEKLSEAVQKVFDFRPAAIIERLNLRRPIYRQVAAYGHFGRPDLDLTWEKADQTEALKKAVLA